MLNDRVDAERLDLTDAKRWCSGHDKQDPARQQGVDSRRSRQRALPALEDTGDRLHCVSTAVTVLSRRCTKKATIVY